jgi:proteasome lid subunit RPN8/RPN11
MLHLPREQFQKIVAHGLEGKPLEICGFLAGRSTPEGKEVLEVFPIESDDKSELTYSMNPLQQLRAEKEIRALELEIVGIYHTHPATVPYPSKTDVARAHWGETDELMFPDYSYLIVSLREPHAPEPRSFHIRGRRIPEDIHEESVAIL